MSFIWNVMLAFDNEEIGEDEQELGEKCEPLERINAWLSPGRLVSLISPTYENEVGSGMDADSFGGGFKHFDIDGFIEIVKAQEWKDRSKVQLWVKGAEEGMSAEPFALVKFGRRRAASNPSSITRKRRLAVAKAPQTKKRQIARKSAAMRKGKTT